MGKAIGCCVGCQHRCRYVCQHRVSSLSRLMYESPYHKIGEIPPNTDDQDFASDGKTAISPRPPHNRQQKDAGHPPWA